MEKSKKQRQALFLYLCLTGMFVSLLIACNLIFLKFFEWEPIDDVVLILSVGLIPYPITFLITDLVSEIYGQKRANDVVIVGLICTVLVTILTIVADMVPAMPLSVVDDATFHRVFGLTGASVSASMIAYLFAQFIDIKIFHFWKVKTKGKQLWIRNNLSTIPSQLVDSVMVISLLCFFGALPWGTYLITVLSLFGFKMLVALLDTPFFYLFTFLIKRHFKLGDMDELEL